MTKIIDGKKISTEIKDEVKEKVARLKETTGVETCLAVILVGDNQASQVYVRNKKKACEYAGIKSLSYELPASTSEEELLTLIENLNNDNSVNGILLQLPLPKEMHADEQRLLNAIRPDKDVDGFHPENVGALFLGLPGFLSCTPAGIIQLLKRSGIETTGKECVIAGRSNIVGKPMALLMLRENATVTVIHTKTKNEKEICKRADILITATGQAKHFGPEHIKEGAVVIDCGMDRDENNKLCGDVDYEAVFDHVSAITPVPGGVGPMTIAMLISNCYESAAKKAGITE